MEPRVVCDFCLLKLQASARVVLCRGLMENDKIKLGVLWKHVSRDGTRKYLTGSVRNENLDEALALMRDGGRLLVLGNEKRPGKQDPDCALFVVPASSPPKAPPAKKR